VRPAQHTPTYNEARTQHLRNHGEFGIRRRHRWLVARSVEAHADLTFVENFYLITLQNFHQPIFQVLGQFLCRGMQARVYAFYFVEQLDHFLNQFYPGAIVQRVGRQWGNTGLDCGQGFFRPRTRLIGISFRLFPGRNGSACRAFSLCSANGDEAFGLRGDRRSICQTWDRTFCGRQGGRRYFGTWSCLLALSAFGSCTLNQSCPRFSPKQPYQADSSQTGQQRQDNASEMPFTEGAHEQKTVNNCNQNPQPQ
jgi:hypothetical protein